MFMFVSGHSKKRVAGMKQIIQFIHFLTGKYLSLPGILQVGLIVFALGAALDIVFHIAPAGWSSVLRLILGQDGHIAHLVTFAGMVIIVVGILPIPVPGFLAYRHRS